MALALFDTVNANSRLGRNMTGLKMYNGSISADTDTLVHTASNENHYIAVMMYQFGENQALDLIFKSDSDTIINLDLPAHTPRGKDINHGFAFITKKGGDLYVRSTQTIGSFLIGVMEFDQFYL